jgi:hypothetical protein
MEAALALAAESVEMAEQVEVLQKRQADILAQKKQAEAKQVSPPLPLPQSHPLPTPLTPPPPVHPHPPLPTPMPHPISWERHAPPGGR